jgi:hypothetical protein
MRDLASLTAGDFEAVLGSEFEITDGGTGPLRVRLSEVVRLDGPPEHRRPFLVHFQGPPSPVLAQVVHHVVHAEMGEFDLFLGPVFVGPATPRSEGTTYEAIFA